MADRAEDSTPATPPEPVGATCAWCGATVDEVPFTWSTSLERGRVVHYCDRCSRDHLRSLEAKLDPEYW